MSEGICAPGTWITIQSAFSILHLTFLAFIRRYLVLQLPWGSDRMLVAA